MVLICKENDCTGCAACENACKQKAIKMVYNAEGFLHPDISNDKCIECKACITVCPVVNYKSTDKRYPINAYKGNSKNIDLLKFSTSGGIFSEIASIIFSENGVVFGAILDEDLHVKHIVAENMNDLTDLRGSKYIGSNLTGIYNDVISRLKRGQKVLFSGTPCQVAGLYRILGGVHNQLITCDFVCHGVGSQIIFEKYIHYNELLHKAQAKKIYFRSKQRGYLNSSMVIEYDNGEQTISPSYRNGFGYAFSRGMINRKACSHCLYASPERLSDITLCDCIHGLEPFEKKNGCSYILVNSELGRECILKANLNLLEIEISKVMQMQPHLSTPQKMNIQRDAIMRDLSKSYDLLYHQYLMPPRRNLFKSIKERIKHAKSKWH